MAGAASIVVGRMPSAHAFTFTSAVGSTLAWGLAACGAGAESAPQAVVLITCDTLRADHLGCYGHARNTSPSLDALARESVVYESAWSTVPVTGPALSALMTGRMPEELGLQSNRTLLAGTATTLAERARAAGFETAAVVSNWVLRRRDEVPEAGLAQGFEHYDDHMEVPERSRPDLRERFAPETTDAALAWLDARRGEHPFFLWVHYQDPHGPYTPPDELLAEFAPEPRGEAALEPGHDETGRGALPAYQVIDAERRPEVYRARYEAEIRLFDRELGRLLDGLRARGVLERALLVFTADHGESLGEHGYYFSHGQHLHRELLHVPLLVRPPGSARAGERVRTPVSHLDLHPTLLAGLGLEPGPTRGLDLLGAALPPERIVPHNLRGAWSVTDARHRLLVSKEGRQLFDVLADPREEHDLFAREPARARTLAETYQAMVHSVPLLRLSAVRPDLGARERAELEALGYVGEDDPEDDADDH
jgi:arylsulfatase